MGTTRSRFEVPEIIDYLRCPRWYYYERIQKLPFPYTTTNAAVLANASALEATIRENLDQHQHEKLFEGYFEELLEYSHYKMEVAQHARSASRVAIGIFHNIERRFMPDLPWPPKRSEVLEIEGKELSYDITSVFGNNYLSVDTPLLQTGYDITKQIMANLLWLKDKHRNVSTLVFIPMGGNRPVRYATSEKVRSRPFRKHTKNLMLDAIRGINLGFFPRVECSKKFCFKLHCKFYSLCMERYVRNKSLNALIKETKERGV